MKVLYDLVQGTEEAPPLLQTYAHLRGVELRPACVTLDLCNTLLLEPEQQINVIEQLRTCSFYTCVPA